MKKMLYYRFLRKSITWNGEVINAEIQNYSGEHLQIQSEWWYGTPLSISMPDVRFTIAEDGPMPDNYWNATLFDLYSSRMISIFERAGVVYELFPAEIVGKKSGRPLQVGYQVFRLLEIEDVIDLTQSVIRYEDHRGRLIEHLEKLVMNEEFMRKQKPLVRIRGFENITIIHAELMALLDQEGISGCKYAPL